MSSHRFLERGIAVFPSNLLWNHLFLTELTTDKNKKAQDHQNCVCSSSFCTSTVYHSFYMFYHCSSCDLLLLSVETMLLMVIKLSSKAEKWKIVLSKRYLESNLALKHSSKVLNSVKNIRLPVVAFCCPIWPIILFFPYLGICLRLR